LIAGIKIIGLPFIPARNRPIVSSTAANKALHPTPAAGVVVSPSLSVRQFYKLPVRRLKNSLKRLSIGQCFEVIGRAIALQPCLLMLAWIRVPSCEAGWLEVQTKNNATTIPEEYLAQEEVGEFSQRVSRWRNCADDGWIDQPQPNEAMSMLFLKFMLRKTDLSHTSVIYGYGFLSTTIYLSRCIFLLASQPVFSRSMYRYDFNSLIVEILINRQRLCDRTR